jgi:Flp pilus assembly protein CpaB
MMGLLARAVFMLIQTIATAGSFVLPESRTDRLLIYGFTGTLKAA